VVWLSGKNLEFIFVLIPNFMSCVRFTIFTSFYDMGGLSTWTLGSAIACSKGKKPVLEEKVFTLHDGETFDDVGYKLCSNYYDDARRIESIPTVGYRFSIIPSVDE